MSMGSIPWNATAFQLTNEDNAVRRATAVIYEDGRVVGNIADGVLRAPTKANQVAYHEKFLRQHLQFAGMACRVVVVQHVRPFEDAMSFSVKQAWSRWGARNVLATFDELPKQRTREHEFTKKGQGLLFAFKQNESSADDEVHKRDDVHALYCPNLRERLAHYGVFY